MDIDFDFTVTRLAKIANTNNSRGMGNSGPPQRIPSPIGSDAMARTLLRLTLRACFVSAVTPCSLPMPAFQCRWRQQVGYYSLSAGSVRSEESPARVAKGLAKHPIGVILLVRLAVDRTEHGGGLGRIMLVDALSRAMTTADAIGARAMLVHAIDEDMAERGDCNRCC
jgi:hypothetical protein